jgi:radical SAM protein (TIGR01212 family)
MDFPWGHHRRFNSYTEYFRKEFGGRVQKVTIDAGFTCPNRDGKIGSGGCTYCNNNAFNPSYCLPQKGIIRQIEEGIEFHANRYRHATKFLAYFQAFSNTYAPLVKLKELYSEALAVPGIIGLVIGTRPDCIDEEKLDYLQELSKNYYIMVEYGIETCNNAVLKQIHRGHTYEASVEAIGDTVAKGIKTGAHFIFGLPGESRGEMLNQVDKINLLPLNNIKFHQLQIIKGTEMAEQYRQNPDYFQLFDRDEYIEFFISFLERLNPAFVVERFTAEVPPRFLEGPGWGLLRTNHLLNLLEKKLEEKDSWQGKYFKG